MILKSPVGSFQIKCNNNNNNYPSRPVLSQLPPIPTAETLPQLLIQGQGTNTPEVDNVFVVPDDLTRFCEASRINSLSIGHYATVLTKHIFSDKERENRNCLGRRNKLALDAAKLGLVKKLVFRYYAIKDDQREVIWRDCIKRIDDMLGRKQKSSQGNPFSV